MNLRDAATSVDTAVTEVTAVTTDVPSTAVMEDMVDMVTDTVTVVKTNEAIRQVVGGHRRSRNRQTILMSPPEHPLAMITL